ncbi:MAG: hypothetical protein HY254_11345 [Burkholderiales bacterium]|nr:hypothetical protein [Burkholderiales bacterium]
MNTYSKSVCKRVSPKDAGQRLPETIGPPFEEIEAELSALSEFKDKLAGNICITTAEHAANYVQWPKLEKFLHDYPDIKVEINVDTA